MGSSASRFADKKPRPRRSALPVSASTSPRSWGIGQAVIAVALVATAFVGNHHDVARAVYLSAGCIALVLRENRP